MFKRMLKVPLSTLFLQSFSVLSFNHPLGLPPSFVCNFILNSSDPVLFLSTTTTTKNKNTRSVSFCYALNEFLDSLLCWWKPTILFCCLEWLQIFHPNGTNLMMVKSRNAKWMMMRYCCLLNSLCAIKV